jgi:hypothetical protein
MQCYATAVQGDINLHRLHLPLDGVHVLAGEKAEAEEIFILE